MKEDNRYYTAAEDIEEDSTKGRQKAVLLRLAHFSSFGGREDIPPEVIPL